MDFTAHSEKDTMKTGDKFSENIEGKKNGHNSWNSRVSEMYVCMYVRVTENTGKKIIKICDISWEKVGRTSSSHKAFRFHVLKKCL